MIASTAPPEPRRRDRPGRPLDHGAAGLPTEARPWPRFTTRRVAEAAGNLDGVSREELRRYAAGQPFVWPSQPHFFLCDVHADTDAFLASLEATGGVRRTGAGDAELELTEAGRRAVFVIGGDCLDKGPDNLRLLRALDAFRRSGAEVVLLAGNHDVRALLGLVHAGSRDPRLAHLFVRMGKKSAPLFKEIHDRYLAGTPAAASPLDDAAVRARLFPPVDWRDEFPDVARDWMPAEKLQREVRRIAEKTAELEQACAALGLGLPMLHAAWQQARRLFLAPDGELAWFFGSMQLAHRAGSFLFVHAGVDDVVGGLLRRDGVDGLNSRFRELLATDLFALYHGPVGNVFRTKYRDTDHRLTRDGVAELRRCGIHAVVHGHRNLLHGQRLVIRADLLNVECDVSLDANTRRLEGLPGPGVGATLLEPDGTLRGISTDHPYVKTLRANTVFDLMTIVPEPESETEMTRTEADQEPALDPDRDQEDAPVATKKKAKTEVHFESSLPLEEAVSYFEAIVAGMRRGTIHFRQGEESLRLDPPAHVSIEVDAATKGDNERIRFEIAWRKPTGNDLRISSD